MTRQMRGLALVIFGAAVSACTALAGLTDDYRLANGDGTAGEGGSTDGNVGKDGALPDGFVPGSDGGADATQDQLVGDGGAFCDSVPQMGLEVCDDFENDGSTTWTTNNDVGAGATSMIAPTGGMNGSAGLQLAINLPVGSPSKHFWKAKLLPQGNNPTTYQHYEVQFDFRVSSGTLAYAAIGTLSFTSTADPEQDHGVAVGNGNSFGTPPSIGTAVTDNNIPAPHWHRMHLLLDRGSSPSSPYIRKLTITDSLGAVTTIDSGSSHVIAAAGDTELRIGTFNTFTSGAGALQVVFDNVFVRRYQ
jgi:hypothetical protein